MPAARMESSSCAACVQANAKLPLMSRNAMYSRTHAASPLRVAPKFFRRSIASSDSRAERSPTASSTSRFDGK